MIWWNTVIKSTTTDKRNQRVAKKLTNSKFSSRKRSLVIIPLDNFMERDMYTKNEIQATFLGKERDMYI